MTPFDAPDPALIAALVQERPLALLVSGGPGGFHVTPLPLLPRYDAAGGIASFEGHFARRNPQVEALRADPHAFAIFQGPQRYIPADTVADPDWVPTWNYVVAQFDVEIAFVPEDNRGSVDRLVERLEPGGWRPATHVPHRHEGMLAHVVAFEARVHRAGAKFKLGQDERTGHWNQIVDWLGGDPLADWMRRARSGND